MSIRLEKSGVRTSSYSSVLEALTASRPGFGLSDVNTGSPRARKSSQLPSAQAANTARSAPSSAFPCQQSSAQYCSVGSALNSEHSAPLSPHSVTSTCRIPCATQAGKACRAHSMLK